MKSSLAVANQPGSSLARGAYDAEAERRRRIDESIRSALLAGGVPGSNQRTDLNALDRVARLQAILTEALAVLDDKEEDDEGN